MTMTSKLAHLAAAAGLLCALSAHAGSPAPADLPDPVKALVSTKDAQTALSPDQALEKLKEGNLRFIGGKTLHRDYPSQVKITGHGQFPYASVVSCIDSRSGPELVFDQGIGDLFSPRIAGNFVNDDIIGSLEFASKVAGAKLIVVLGHTSCGAIKGACDNVQLGKLTGVLGKIRPAVDATPGDGDRSAKNYAFVDQVAKTNVLRNVQAILDGSDVLREMAAKGEIKVVGAMLDVKTGVVTFY